MVSISLYLKRNLGAPSSRASRTGREWECELQRNHGRVGGVADSHPWKGQEPALERCPPKGGGPSGYFSVMDNEDQETQSGLPTARSRQAGPTRHGVTLSPDSFHQFSNLGSLADTSSQTGQS